MEKVDFPSLGNSTQAAFGSSHTELSASHWSQCHHLIQKGTIIPSAAGISKVNSVPRAIMNSGKTVSQSMSLQRIFGVKHTPASVCVKEPSNSNSASWLFCALGNRESGWLGDYRG